MENKNRQIVIPKENAVFWLDKNGCWRNKHGKFRHKKIIDYFHHAIDRDEDGYFVIQDKGDGFTEKVYFPYEDTALFVFEVVISDKVALVLNTGEKIGMLPENLRTKGDQLYMYYNGHRIKFTERALMKIAGLMVEAGKGYAICLSDKKTVIQEE